MMNFLNRRRRALVAAALLATVGVAWAATNDSGAHVDHNASQAAGAPDPHAGHDMGGITVGADGIVTLPPGMAAAVGVVTVAAELGTITHDIRTTGHVTWDETRLTTITPKFSGFVERLYVDNTGQSVRRGQAVLEIYSPQLVAAQEELLTAVRLDQRLGTSAAPGVAERSLRLADAARQKLRLWDIPEVRIAEIERTGEVRRTLTLHAPSSGIVVEKLVQAGQAVDAGSPLYRLADLSTVWVDADIYEQDLRFVRLNGVVHVELAAYPGQTLDGRVTYIYPEMQQETRTARIRVTLANGDGRIKPGMFASVHIENPVAGRAVLVPRDAIMRTGTRNLVFVEIGAGVFEPRVVVVGADAGGDTQVISGLLVGERVVSRANFLLDSESRLMENMGGMADMPGMSH
jgi:membrane fusion protein, copper/silver efflux system